MTPAPYTLDQYVADLRKITQETSDEDKIFTRLGPLAQRLASNKDWLKKEHYHADPDQGFGVHVLHEEPDHTLAVFAVSWLPGRGTPPHDHGTWAVVVGIDGIEHNTRYKRLDDGKRSDYAELAVKDAINAAAGDVIYMKKGGIHAVKNETDQVTLSLHTYGKHINHTDRSQFNLKTHEKKDFIVALE